MAHSKGSKAGEEQAHQTHSKGTAAAERGRMYVPGQECLSRGGGAGDRPTQTHSMHSNVCPRSRMSKSYSPMSRY